MASMIGGAEEVKRLGWEDMGRKPSQCQGIFYSNTNDDDFVVSWSYWIEAG